MRKSAIYVATLLTIAALALPAAPVFAEEDWKSMKQESKAMKIKEEAKASLNELFADNPKAKELYEGSYGWAAFANLKIALGFSGGGGNGVAVVKETGAKTFMKMGTAGVGLGLGVNKYDVIFLFQDKQTFDNFVNKGWQADLSANAAAGTSGKNAPSTFSDGVAVFQMTNKGLVAQADIAGTKYWKNDKLNK